MKEAFAEERARRLYFLGFTCSLRLSPVQNKCYTTENSENKEEPGFGNGKVCLLCQNVKKFELIDVHTAASAP